MKKRDYYEGDTIDRELEVRAENGSTIPDENIVSVEVATVDPNGGEEVYTYGTHPEQIIHPGEGYYRAYLPTDAAGTWWVEWRVQFTDDTGVVTKYTSNAINVKPRKVTSL